MIVCFALMASLSLSGCTEKTVTAPQKNTTTEISKDFPEVKSTTEAIKSSAGAVMPEELPDKTLEYLNSLYDDNFEIVSYMSSGMDGKSENVMVKSQKYSDKTFCVKFKQDGDSMIPSDNYYTLYMLEDATEYASGIVKEELPEATISVEFTELNRPKKLPEKATFQDYIKMGGSSFFCINIETDEFPGEDQCNKIIDNFKSENFKCHVFFKAGENVSDYQVKN